jgi:hypothetical protein
MDIRGRAAETDVAALDAGGRHPGCSRRSSQIRAWVSGCGLLGAAARTVRAVRKHGEPSLLVAGDPGMNALARHAQAPGDLAHLLAVLHDGEYRLIPLLHDAELHQHGGPTPSRQIEARMTCQGSAGVTVKGQPNQVGTISRNGVKPKVTPERPASPGTRQTWWAPRDSNPEPADKSLVRPCGQRAARRLSCAFASQ